MRANSRFDCACAEICCISGLAQNAVDGCALGVVELGKEEETPIEVNNLRPVDVLFLRLMRYDGLELTEAPTSGAS